LINNPIFTVTTETTASGEYNGKSFELRYDEREHNYEIDGNFTLDEQANIAMVFEVTNEMKSQVCKH
jgi:hypothetical protein